MKSKKFGITILFSTFILIAVGCSSTTIEYPEPAVNALDEDFNSHIGIFEYGDKNYNADYGTLTVKENRSKSGSRLIHLPVIRINARTKNSNEPIFSLAGGPGQTNMNWSPIDSLLFDHDFVMVGYRGVDGSSVLDCPEVADAIEDSKGDDLLGEESLKNIGEAWKTGAERLISEGVDLNGYTIPETINDMEAARRALKYDRINLISGSYGTRVAYLYGLRYPEKIHRSVMMGVNPPGHFIWNPKIADEQIKHYSKLWSKDSVMSQRCPDLAAAMKRVLNNMPKKWLLFSIDPGKVKTVASCLLFERKGAALVFDAFVDADQGDYSGLALMSMAFDYILPSMFTWGELAAKAVSADLDYWNKNENEMNQPYEILGAPMNDLLWKTLKYNQFPVKTIPGEFQTLQASEVETLLLNGNLDSSTPPENPSELLPYLKNGKQIILSEYGHVGDVLYLRKGMIDELITDYINSGNADTSKIKYVPMNFDVGWGFPGVAKVGLGTVTVVALALLTVVYFLIK